MYLHAWILYTIKVTSLNICSHACNVILNSLQQWKAFDRGTLGTGVQAKDPIAWQVCVPHDEKQVLNYPLCHHITVL